MNEANEALREMKDTVPAPTLHKHATLKVKHTNLQHTKKDKPLVSLGRRISKLP